MYLRERDGGGGVRVCIPRRGGLSTSERVKSTSERREAGKSTWESWLSI